MEKPGITQGIQDKSFAEHFANDLIFNSQSGSAMIREEFKVYKQRYSNVR